MISNEGLYQGIIWFFLVSCFVGMAVMFVDMLQGAALLLGAALGLTIFVTYDWLVSKLGWKR